MSFGTILDYTYNRNQGVKLTILSMGFLTGDKEGHTFRIAVVDRKGSVDLTGASVTGWFIPNDQGLVDDQSVPLKGSVEGNVAILSLPPEAYLEEGRFSLVIKLNQEGRTSTIFWGAGSVSRSKTDVFVDVGDVIPSLEELLAQIDELEKATESAKESISFVNEAANRANAAADNVIELQGSVEQAINTVEEVAEEVKDATASANDAMDRANTAADTVAALKVSVEQAIDNTVDATKKAKDATDDANAATERANAAADLVAEKIESINSDIKTAGDAQIRAISESGNNQIVAVNTSGSAQTALIKNAGDAQIDAINSAGANQISAINSAGEGHVDSINAAVENAVIKTEELEEAVATQVSKVNDAGTEQIGVVNAAAAQQLSAIDNRAANSLASIPEDYTALYNRAVRNTDTKADAIIDTSVKAASHTLHAQDAPIHVTLFGQTYQAGSGDPSPDNVRPISGVDVASVHCGGKNLLHAPYRSETKTENGVTFTVNADGSVSMSGTATASTNFHIFSDSDGTDYDLIDGQTYFYSGCPAGGSEGTYQFHCQNSNNYRENGDGKTFVYKRSATKNRMFFSIASGVNVDGLVLKPMLCIGNTAQPWEPYNANAVDMTAALNGKALYGDGTVMDTVENDVLSGCDKCVILDGTQSNKLGITELTNTVRVSFDDLIVDKTPQGGYPSHLFTSRFHKVVALNDDYEHMYSNVHGTVLFFINKTKLSSVDEAGIKEYFAANPLHVYYRSTEYTPDKDLRVCKVERMCRTAVMDASLLTVTGTQVEGEARFSYPKFSDWNAYNNYNSIINVGHWASEKLSIANVSTTINSKIMIIKLAAGTTLEDARAIIADTKFVYQLATPEVYMTDPIELRKPAGLMPVTVTGSGETAVEYAHDTKHYIDSKISDLVTLALANQ